MNVRSLFLLLYIPLWVVSQELAQVEPLYLIDTPTAGTLFRGSFRTHIRAYNDGGLLAGIDVGVLDRLMFGISYGGTNVVGIGDIDWNPQVGVNVRYRLFEESLTMPAISVGYNSQGYGVYIDSTSWSRYTEKSLGVFAVASKNFYFLGTFGVHGGVNYSFEDEDDSDPNLFFGFDKSINPELAFSAEYDLALNDNEDASFGSGKGYLNAGLKWIFASKLEIELLVKNLLKNRKDLPHMAREIRISYIETF
jgi:hypothetical protein